MAHLETLLASNEALVRLSAFLGMLMLMLTWERIAPLRRPVVRPALRWMNNLGLVVLNSIALRLLFPIAAVGVAVIAEQRGWGLLNQMELGALPELLLAILLLDFAIWAQHLVFHKVDLLWRLHRVHHADPDFDVTTGLRFHPIEILLSMGIKIGVVLLIGPAAIAVILFEISLNISAMFNHGNVQLPAPLDRALRWLLVTPDMHRIHHSVERQETDSNYGFALSWWDRLFGTYRAQAEAGQLGMSIGLREFSDARDSVWINGLLLLPFKGRPRGGLKGSEMDSEGHVDRSP